MSRKFYLKNKIIDNNEIILKGDEYHHICNVLRKKIGDTIVLVDEVGNNYECEIVSITKEWCQLKIVQKINCDNETKTKITVFLGNLKGEKCDFVTQKLCELGVNELVIFDNKFSIAKINDKKIERLNKISVEATKQCGRSKPLIVSKQDNLKSCETLFNSFDYIFVAYENEKDSLKQTLNSLVLNGKKIAVVIGCEGGFSKEEIDYLKTINARILSLGSRILRSETAVLSLCSIIMFCAEEMG